ncbi:MAG: NAD(P)-dependent alcohol dehydrogenase, partial [Candidatus Dormibacteraeota bacterium]|nr:NAD(P)-dependent alcohol dehydrogenase [Candidatus Dormibacteraeota bacterium]
MKAAVFDRYGPASVMRIADVPQPVPAGHEVRVRVHATSVNRTDTGIRSGEPFPVRIVAGMRRPRHRILGTEFAGTVDAVGGSVSAFAVGDQVFGLNPWRFGTHAEFVCVREQGVIATTPEGWSFEQAAAVCDGAILALINLRRVHLQRGQRLLVYGASGSIGTAAVQLAVAFGAHVTAVCGPNATALVHSLGAHDVLDYTQQDFAAGGEQYDVIFDAVGKEHFLPRRHALRRGGVWIASDGLTEVALAMLNVRVEGRRVSSEIPPRFLRRDVW